MVAKTIVGVSMKIDPWALMAVLLGVLVYTAVPVALAVIYVSRVHAWLSQKNPKKGVNRSAGELDNMWLALPSHLTRKKGVNRSAGEVDSDGGH